MFEELSKSITIYIGDLECEVDIADLERGFYFAIGEGGDEIGLSKEEVDIIIDNWYVESGELRKEYEEQREHERQEWHGWEQV